MKARRLGSSGAAFFVDIYLAVNIQTGGEIAMKLESFKAKHLQLRYELKLLKHLDGVPGLPEYAVESWS